MTLDLNAIMLGSEDPKRLADFYQEVLGRPTDWTDADNGWYGWRIGASNLAIGPHSDVKGKAAEPARVMMNFETPDVRAEFDRISSSGAQVVAEPYEPGAGMTMCTFADPDGNYFQLASPWTGDDPQ